MRTRSALTLGLAAALLACSAPRKPPPAPALAPPAPASAAPEAAPPAAPAPAPPPVAETAPPAPAETPIPPAATPKDMCGAWELAALVGKPRTEIPVPVDPSHRRVYCTTCPVTQDYDPTRLDILFDARTGKVAAVKCG